MCERERERVLLSLVTKVRIIPVLTFCGEWSQGP